MNYNKDILLKLVIDGKYLHVKEVEVIPIGLFMFLRWLDPIIEFYDIGFSTRYSESFKICYEPVTDDADQILAFLSVYPWDTSSFIENFMSESLATDMEDLLISKFEEIDFPISSIEEFVPLIMEGLKKDDFQFLDSLRKVCNFIDK